MKRSQKNRKKKSTILKILMIILNLTIIFTIDLKEINIDKTSLNYNCQSSTIYGGIMDHRNAEGPHGGQIYNDHEYLYISIDNMTWTEAKAYAESQDNGHLVTITSSEENAFLYSYVDSLTVGSIGRFWIGLTDEIEEGVFQWITGEALSFSTWNANNPNNGEGRGEDYVHMDWDGKWNDHDSTVRYQLVIEWDNQIITLFPIIVILPILAVISISTIAYIAVKKHKSSKSKVPMKSKVPVKSKVTVKSKVPVKSRVPINSRHLTRSNYRPSR